MTVLGPLTPTTRPSSCSTDTKLYGVELSDRAYGLLGPTNTQECMPPGYSAGASNNFYPASICPYGYTTGCDPSPVTVVEDNAILVIQIAYTCCPTQQAFSCMPTNPTLTYMSSYGCTYNPTTSWHTTITSLYLNGTTSTTSIDAPNGNDGFQAYAIQLRAPIPSSDSSSSLSSSAATSSAARSDGGRAGLSTAASAGIGIGAAVAGMGIGLLAFFVYRRRQDQRNAKDRKVIDQASLTYPSTYPPKDVLRGAVLEMGTHDPNQPELSGDEFRHGHARVGELDGSRVAELDGR